jgi:hypothetical protein
MIGFRRTRMSALRDKREMRPKSQEDQATPEEGSTSKALSVQLDELNALRPL